MSKDILIRNSQIYSNSEVINLRRASWLQNAYEEEYEDENINKLVQQICVNGEQYFEEDLKNQAFYLGQINKELETLILSLQEKDINALKLLKRSVKQYFIDKIMPFLQREMDNFQKYQQKIQNVWLKDLKVSGMIEQIENCYQMKFESQRIAFIKEILLLQQYIFFNLKILIQKLCKSYLLKSDDPRDIIHNQNDNAILIFDKILNKYQNKFSSLKYEKPLFDQFFKKTNLVHFKKMTEIYFLDMPIPKKNQWNNIFLQYQQQQKQIQFDQKSESNMSFLNFQNDQVLQIHNLLIRMKENNIRYINNYKDNYIKTEKIALNLRLIKCRFEEIFIMSGQAQNIQSVKPTEEILKEELLNLHFKTKSKVLKSQLKIEQYKKDFSQMDSEISQLMLITIPELEKATQLYIADLKTNKFINYMNVNVQYDYHEKKTYNNNTNTYDVETWKTVRSWDMDYTSRHVHIDRSLSLEQLASNLLNFIQRIKGLVQNYHQNQLLIQQEIKNLDNDQIYKAARQLATQRKNILKGGNLNQIQKDYEFSLNMLDKQTQSLKSNIEAVTYNIFLNDILHFEVPQMIAAYLCQITNNSMQVKQILKIMALLIRQKLKMENSKFVSNEKRIDETMFLSTNDLINVLRKSELPNDIYLKSVVLLLTDLAKKKTHNAFQVFQYHPQFRMEFRILKKFIIKYFNSINTKNRQETDFDLNQKAFQQLYTQFQRLNKDKLSECGRTQQDGCCSNSKQLVSLQKITEVFDKKYEKIIYLSKDINKFKNEKFVFQFDFTNGSNAETFLRIFCTNPQYLIRKKQCCCCCCC